MNEVVVGTKTLAPDVARFESLNPQADRPINIIPPDDAAPHRHGIDCPCRPWILRAVAGSDGLVLVHRCWDCRDECVLLPSQDA